MTSKHLLLGSSVLFATLVAVLFTTVIITACRSAAAAEELCEAKGHGPYDMKLAECYDLAERQAHTDCSLHDVTSTVQMKHQVTAAAKVSTATCTSVYSKEKNSCLPSECTPTLKSAH